MKRILWLAGLAVMMVGLRTADSSVKDLSRALTFHSSFDRGIDADFALGDRRPSHKIWLLLDRDDVRRSIEAVATPLVGLGGRFLGVLQMFWEVAS